MVTQLFTVILLFTVVAAFGSLLLFLTSLVGPKLKQSHAKLMPYECGVSGQENDTTKIPIKFYLTAILFILFDIEVIFMYPWALVFAETLRSSGAFIFYEMLVFMAILLFGLFYVWRGKGLQWE